MYGIQICILKKACCIGLCHLLQCMEGSGLGMQITFLILHDFPYPLHKGCLMNQEAHGSLDPPDVTEGHSAQPESSLFFFSVGPLWFSASLNPSFFPPSSDLPLPSLHHSSTSSHPCVSTYFLPPLILYNSGHSDFSHCTVQFLQFELNTSERHLIIIHDITDIMSVFSHFWFHQPHPFSKRNKAGPNFRGFEVNLLVCCENTFPPLKSPNLDWKNFSHLISIMAEEQERMWEVLTCENQEFQENLVPEVSHTYLIFSYYISRFIGTNFYLLYFILSPNFQNFMHFQYFRVWMVLCKKNLVYCILYISYIILL